jgi:hypothetical protein
MRFLRSAIVSLCVVILAACWVVGLSGQVPAQLPMEPILDSGASIIGAFEGWYKNNDGSYSILVGYLNRNQKQILDIPVGPDNHIDPGGPDQGQPTHFLPRRQWGVFTLIVPKDFGTKRLTWTITANGQTTSIPLHIDPLWVVEPFEDAGVGNTPPVVRFQQGGMAFTGPPRGFAATFNTKVNEALPLTAWVSDDGKQPPEPAPAKVRRQVSCGASFAVRAMSNSTMSGRSSLLTTVKPQPQPNLPPLVNMFCACRQTMRAAMAAAASNVVGQTST